MKYGVYVCGFMVLSNDGHVKKILFLEIQQNLDVCSTSKIIIITKYKHTVDALCSCLYVYR